MKTTIFAAAWLFVGFVSGTAFQHTQDQIKVTNLSLDPLELLLNGVPTTLQFDDVVVLEPGGEIEIMEVH